MNNKFEYYYLLLITMTNINNLPAEISCYIFGRLRLKDLAAVGRVNKCLYEFIEAFYGAKMAWFRRISNVNKQLRLTITHIIFNLDLTYYNVDCILAKSNKCISLIDTGKRIFIYTHLIYLKRTIFDIMYNKTVRYYWDDDFKYGWKTIHKEVDIRNFVFTSRTASWIYDLQRFAHRYHKLVDNKQLRKSIISISNEDYKLPPGAKN